MSEQGDAQRWRPTSGPSGVEPDDPTGPIPVVTDDMVDSPGFPPVADESPNPYGDAETTGGFPAVAVNGDGESTGGFPAASKERAPFEPADPSPEEQSFTALRRSFAERMARYTEPDGGWPDPPPTEAASGEQTTTDEEWSAFRGGNGSRQRSSLTEREYGEPVQQERPPSGEEPPAHDGPAFAEPRSSGEERPDAGYGPAFAEPPSSGGERPAGAESPGRGGAAFAEPSSFGQVRPGGEEPPAFAEPWSSVQERPDGAESPGYGGAVFAEPPSFGQGRPAGQERSATEEDAENEFFVAEEHPSMYDKVPAPSGPPPQPGKPSSGNMRMPDWMKEGAPPPADHEEKRRSRLPLYAGIGVLVLGLLAAGGVVLLKKSGGDPPADPAASPTAPATGRANLPRNKALAQFRGPHTLPAGRVADLRAGLSYPRLRKPWAVVPTKSPMREIGFSASQFAVTERAGGRPARWGRLMSAELAGSERAAYHGPGTERVAALRAAELYEARMYAFRHRKRLLASQPIDVGGHRGWLVGYYMTYHRPGARATADVFTVAVVDTGRAAPGVLFMTVPNTHRRLWPDVNYVIRALKVI